MHVSVRDLLSHARISEGYSHMHVPVRDLLKVQETHMKMYMNFVHTKRVWPLTYLQVTRGGCPVDDAAGWPSHPMLCRQ